jgi:beta-N-acetylhexosaminidase
MPNHTQAASQAKSFESFWNNLSPERRAGMFLWPSLSGTDISQEEEALFLKYQPSGVILFRRNFTSLAQAKHLCDKLHKLAAQCDRLFPLMIAIDEEGGRVSRLPQPFIRGKSVLELIDGNDLEGLESQVVHQAAVSSGLGIRVILAPVTDILTEPNNPVMGDRCFGRTPEEVSNNALLVWKTLRSMGVWGSAKHFPGHGNTTTDSHKGFARSDVSLDTLRKREWKPFKALIDAHIPIVMTAHVLVPALDAERPATLSHTVLQKYLREEMGFDGVIMSDDLRMNAIAEHYKINRQQESDVIDDIVLSAETNTNDSFLRMASMDALSAGCDILLSCQSIVKEDIILSNLSAQISKQDVFARISKEKAQRIIRVFSSQSES